MAILVFKSTRTALTCLNDQIKIVIGEAAKIYDIMVRGFKLLNLVTNNILVGAGLPDAIGLLVEKNHKLLSL